MAKMLPPSPSPDTKSAAEVQMFHRIKNELGSDWTCLHSVGIRHHPRKPWTETDFVLIGPQGVFCLEVKGGRVSRKNGLWHFERSVGGLVDVKQEGPFEQVNGAAAALEKYLRQSSKSTAVNIGCGVAFPDFEFHLEDPAVEPQIVYDCRDTGKSFQAYLQRCVSHWEKRLNRKTVLTASQCKQVLDLLRSDFDFRPSLKTRVSQVNQELLQLTQEQFCVLDGLEENDRVLITGGAGTGKSILAMEEAKRQSSRGKKVLYCCYNTRLAEALATSVSMPGLDVKSLHSVMYKIVHNANRQQNLPPAEEKDLFEVFYPLECVAALLESDAVGIYDCLVVDEAQDLLLKNYVDVFDALLKGGLKRGHWKVFLDSQQNLYGKEGGPALRSICDCSPMRFTLTVNCRNSFPIAQASSLLSGTTMDKVLKVEGPDVVTRFYTDDRHQLRLVENEINRLLSEGLEPKAITVIAERRLENTVFKQPLPNSSFTLQDLGDAGYRSSDRVVGFSTVKSFKGLENDAIIFVDNHDLSRERSATLYTGTSRARAYLCVLIRSSEKSRYEDLAFEFGKRVQQG